VADSFGALGRVWVGVAVQGSDELGHLLVALDSAERAFGVEHPGGGPVAHTGVMTDKQERELVRLTREVALPCLAASLTKLAKALRVGREHQVSPTGLVRPSGGVGAGWLGGEGRSATETAAGALPLPSLIQLRTTSLTETGAPPATERHGRPRAP